MVTGTEPGVKEGGAWTITSELEVHVVTVALAPSIRTCVTWVESAPKNDPANVTATPPARGTTDGVTEVRTGPRNGVETVVPADMGDIPSDVLNRSV
jgi:hypothetical protein